MNSLLSSSALAVSIWMLSGVVLSPGKKPGKANGTSPPALMTPYCFPGQTGWLPCPCQNPPQPGSQLGCENGFTGGAFIDATGSSSILADDLTIVVGNSLPTLHTLYVGNSTANVAFGAGVRCVGSPVTILATGTPTGGPPSSISFTNIYSKSSAAGVPPFAGVTRYYFAGYSNPTMGSTCTPPTSFNASTSGMVNWAL